jgi:hypothetical protein
MTIEDCSKKVDECEMLCKAMSFEMTAATEKIGSLNQTVVSLEERVSGLEAAFKGQRVLDLNEANGFSYLRKYCENLKEDLDKHLISHLKRGSKRGKK